MGRRGKPCLLTMPQVQKMLPSGTAKTQQALHEAELLRCRLISRSSHLRHLKHQMRKPRHRHREDRFPALPPPSSRIDKAHSPSILTRMTVRQLRKQKPFTTADGSTIRSILDSTNSPVEKQSLAEARLSAGGETQRHYHRLSEEIYFMLEGEAWIEVDDVQQKIGPGDAILIPPGAWHQVKAITDIQFLCCCAPVYSHEDTYFE